MDKKKPIPKDEYKKILLKILKKIDYLCEKHGLNYQLAYGTLIGAIRHKGFIPWDDDVDIIMPRKDYMALQKIIQGEKYGINFLTIDTEPDTIYPFGKICATNTVLYEKGFKQVPGYGAFVDVFPLDYVPEDKKKREKIFRKYNFLVKVIQHATRTGYQKSTSPTRTFARAVAYYLTRLVNSSKLIKYVDTSLQNLAREETTNLMGVPWGLGDSAYDKHTIYNTHKVLFEGVPLRISDDYDLILTKRYGDYMQLPPESERISPHGLSCYYK